jgi:hypothetical protein
MKPQVSGRFKKLNCDLIFSKPKFNQDKGFLNQKNFVIWACESKKKGRATYDKDRK